MPRIVVATSADYPDLSASDQLYRTALRAHGAEVGVGVWSEGIAPFRGADLVVLRSTWDYHRDLTGYRAWLDALERAGLAVANPISLVRWNLEKSYLDALSAAGLPTPEQRLLACDRDAVRQAFAETGWCQAVAKPGVGASGHGVILVEPSTLDAVWDELAAAVAPHRLVLQAYVPEIRAEGQVSYVFFAGAFAHAIRNLPRPGEFRINSKFGPTRAVIAPTEAHVAEAAQVVAALPVAPLYARIDMVRQGNRQLLLEAEVHEPGLQLDLVPASADVFARETLAWLA
jgi:glutathione synthase/RimK-type ligase-like ATP-grasp enzyme